MTDSRADELDNPLPGSAWSRVACDASYRMMPKRAFRSAGVALLVACAALAFALATGSETLSLRQLWLALFSTEHSLATDIILQIRMPRALAAFAAGGLLAFAGALMQVLLRNPLADPYILGLAGGAATGALAAMLFALDALLVLGAAWGGAFLSIALVLSLGRRELFVPGSGIEADHPLRLLLIGVALATGWGALITLILAMAPDASLRGMLFWLIGDLDGAESFAPGLLALAVGATLALILGRDLNVLARGSRWAHTLGVSVHRLRIAVLVLASAATAVAVTTVGTVGFVGLIVPNAVRLAVGNDQRLVLPLCALCGGALLTFADTLARTVAAPLQLPVGAVIALIGVPAFIWLVSGRGRRL